MASLLQAVPGQGQRRRRGKHALLELQEQVVLFTTALNALQQENRFLHQRHHLLQRLLLEMDGLGLALNAPDARALEDPDGEGCLPLLAASGTVRSLVALQHTRMLLASHGVDLFIHDSLLRPPLIVWMARPATLRAELLSMTPAAAREWYRERVCDAAMKLKLLQLRVEPQAVEAQLEQIMGSISAWLLGLLLWRPNLVAELSNGSLLHGHSAAGDQAHWHHVASNIALSAEQCTALAAAEDLLGPRLSSMTDHLTHLLQQHLAVLAVDAVDAQDELITAMQRALRGWHGTLVLQLLFCYSTLTPVQLATAAADAYPCFFCEGALTEQLMVIAKQQLSGAAATPAAAAIRQSRHCRGADARPVVQQQQPTAGTAPQTAPQHYRQQQQLQLGQAHALALHEQQLQHWGVAQVCPLALYPQQHQQESCTRPHAAAEALGQPHQPAAKLLLGSPQQLVHHAAALQGHEPAKLPATQVQVLVR